MKLVVKDMNIETGGHLIALMNHEDAVRLDLFPEDRILIRKGRKEITAVVNVAVSKKTTAPGQIGLYEELIERLKAKPGEEVHVYTADKPKSIISIKKKLNGIHLTYEEIKQIIDDLVENKITDSELTYFVSATYTKGMSFQEIISLTKAMMQTGNLFKSEKHPVMDKHCIGGVAGNRTTPLIVPIIAAAGLTMPKTSSRAITSAAGTADTNEVMMKVEMPIEKMKQAVDKTNACMVWGGGQINLAPADDKIIHVEYPLRLDVIGQALASVMAKKLSVSATHLLIDIPIGPSAKVKNLQKAKQIKKEFERIAKHFSIKIKVIITDGTKPIGRGVGPMLEARDILRILRNDKKQSYDLKEKALMMAGIMLEMGGKAKKGKGKEMATKILESGQAYEKFKEIAEAQGKKQLDPEKMLEAEFKFDLRAEKDGRIIKINNRAINRIARFAGCPNDKKSGVYFYFNVGDKVLKHQKIFTIYSESAQKLQYSYEEMERLKPLEIK